MRKPPQFGAALFEDLLTAQPEVPFELDQGLLVRNLNRACWWERPGQPQSHHKVWFRYEKRNEKEKTHNGKTKFNANLEERREGCGKG